MATDFEHIFILHFYIQVRVGKVDYILDYSSEYGRYSSFSIAAH